MPKGKNGERIMGKTQKIEMQNLKITSHGECKLIENIQGNNCSPILLLKGDDYEKGFAYGKLLAKKISKQISRVLTVCFALDGGFVPNGKDVPKKEHIASGKKKALERVNNDLMPAIEKQAPYIMKQVTGMYEGVKSVGEPIDYDDILIFATMPESVDRPAGCSSFAAWGGATKEGNLIHAANQDFESYGILHENIIVLIEQLENGHTYMGPTFLGMLGAASFVNSAGVSYSEMTSSSRPYVWPQIPHYWQAKLIAQNASTIDDAYEIIEKTGGTTGWNILVAETKTEQNAASIEVVGDKIGKRVPGKNTPNRLYVTNHFMAYPNTDGYTGPNLVKEQFELFSTKKSAIKRLYGDENVQWSDIDTAEKFINMIKCPRYEKYAKLLSDNYTNIDTDMAIDAQSVSPICDFGDNLAQKMQYTPPFENLYGYVEPICAQYLRSIYTCVLLPEQGTIYLAAGATPAQDGAFYEYNLQEFLSI